DRSQGWHAEVEGRPLRAGTARVVAGSGSAAGGVRRRRGRARQSDARSIYRAGTVQGARRQDVEPPGGRRRRAVRAQRRGEGGVPTPGGAPFLDPAGTPLPNPNPRVIKNFGSLPDGRTWGSTAGVDIGPDGQLWAYDRCGANSCAGSNVDPILKFDRNTGKLLASFGRGQFIFPHGIHADRDGNVWITDGRAASKEELAKAPDAQGKGHTVTKFSPDGKVLLRLGKPGVGQRGTDTFNEPNDVITAPNGDIFVSDGPNGQNPTATPDTNARIVKFKKA